MSGIETVKIIVEAEKQAARILEGAQASAAEIRKRTGSLLNEQRNGILRSANEQAGEIVRNAERESKIEAEQYEKDYLDTIRQTVARASTRKNAAVTRILAIVTEREV